MSELDQDKQAAEMREMLLKQLKESEIINLDAPISSVFEVVSKLPIYVPLKVVAYDSDKWFFIIKQQ